MTTPRLGVAWRGWGTKSRWSTGHHHYSSFTRMQGTGLLWRRLPDMSLWLGTLLRLLRLPKTHNISDDAYVSACVSAAVCRIHSNPYPITTTLSLSVAYSSSSFSAVLLILHPPFRPWRVVSLPCCIFVLDSALYHHDYSNRPHTSSSHEPFNTAHRGCCLWTISPERTLSETDPQEVRGENHLVIKKRNQDLLICYRTLLLDGLHILPLSPLQRPISHLNSDLNSRHLELKQLHTTPDHLPLPITQCLDTLPQVQPQSLGRSHNSISLFHLAHQLILEL